MEGKVVVITGGGGVLCQTLTYALAKKGASIAVLDLKKEAAERTVKKVLKIGGKAIAIAANVLDKESLIEAREQIRERFGSCDILINGAGGNHPLGTTSNSSFEVKDLNRKKESFTTFFDLEAKGIEFVFNLNFLGTFLPSQVFAEDMISKKGCSILNISSMNAFTPLTKIPAYSGAKAAVSNFTQWLAVHFAKVDIRVNAIAPGFFLTDQNRSLLTDEQGKPTKRGKTIIEHTPMERYGTPEDLIGAVNWLCSEDAGFVTGIIVPIDGGFSAFSGV